jgi:hypothetical protein
MSVKQEGPAILNWSPKIGLRVRLGRQEGSCFVELVAGLEAVIELARKTVEEIPLGGGMPVAGLTSTPVVLVGSRGALQGCERPEKP